MTDLLRVEDLRISFELPQGRLEAVRGVSFRIETGATVALVGESGSGKSVVSQAVMGILPKAARIDGGRILFADQEAARLIGKANGGDGVVDIAALGPDSRAMRAIRAGASPSSSRSP